MPPPGVSGHDAYIPPCPLITQSGHGNETISRFGSDCRQDKVPTLVGNRRSTSSAKYLGLERNALGLVSWDVYDAVLTPGDLILMMVWKAKADAEAFGKSVKLPERGRLRHVSIVRDYGMFDRREAPQYYPPVKREPSGA
jgi:hypothetical protein